MPGFFRERFTDFSQSQGQIYTNNKQGKSKNQSKQLIKICILPTSSAILALQHRKGRGRGREGSILLAHSRVAVSLKTLPSAFAAPAHHLPRTCAEGIHQTSLRL